MIATIQTDSNNKSYIKISKESLKEVVKELVTEEFNELAKSYINQISLMATTIKSLLEDNAKIKTDLRGLDIKGVIDNNKKITELLNSLTEGIPIVID